jgi:hypothetical protein
MDMWRTKSPKSPPWKRKDVQVGILGLLVANKKTMKRRNGMPSTVTSKEEEENRITENPSIHTSKTNSNNACPGPLEECKVS